MFIISIVSEPDDTYEMEHSQACEFLDSLGIIGLEACRDAEDDGQVHYTSDHGLVSIEFSEYPSI